MTTPKKWIDDEVYQRDSSFPRNKLAARVRKQNWMEYKCVECCNDGLWNNKKLVLHLDHINGDSTDHRKDNLRWLCPNCHSQTDTYCKNKPKK